MMIRKTNIRIVIIEGYNRREIEEYFKRCFVLPADQHCNDFIERSRRAMPIGLVTEEYCNRVESGKKPRDIFYVESLDGSFWGGFLKYRTANKREEFLYRLYGAYNINEM